MRSLIAVVLASACASPYQFEATNLPPFNDAPATVLSTTASAARVEIDLNNDAFADPERMSVAFDVVPRDVVDIELQTGDAIEVVGGLSQFDEAPENSYWRLLRDDAVVFEGGLIVRNGGVTGIDIDAIFSLETGNRAVVIDDAGVTPLGVGETTVIERGGVRFRAVAVENVDNSMRGYAYPIE